METDLLPAGEGEADLWPAGEGEADLLPAAGEGGEAVLIFFFSATPLFLMLSCTLSSSSPSSPSLSESSSSGWSFFPSSFML